MMLTPIAIIGAIREQAPDKMLHVATRSSHSACLSG
jgi:hypothetical protein